MEDTETLKQIAKYGLGLSSAAVIANPLAGGTGLIISGTCYVVAELIDRRNRTDS